MTFWMLAAALGLIGYVLSGVAVLQYLDWRDKRRWRGLRKRLGAEPD